MVQASSVTILMARHPAFILVKFACNGFHPPLEVGSEFCLPTAIAFKDMTAYLTKRRFQKSLTLFLNYKILKLSHVFVH
jgi:hypothetical protein